MCASSSTIVRLLTELCFVSRGELEKLNLVPWVLCLILSLDICVDGFHHPNHKEAWCRELLDPKKRGLPENFNTQAVCVVLAWCTSMPSVHLPCIPMPCAGRAALAANHQV